MDRPSIVRRIQASRRGPHSATSLQWIIRDEHVAHAINFGAELVILQALKMTDDAFFLAADREAFSCLGVPSFGFDSGSEGPNYARSCFTSPELSLECRM